MAQNTLTMNELVKTYLNLQESIQHQFVMADNKFESGEKREALKLFVSASAPSATSHPTLPSKIRQRLRRFCRLS